MPVTADKPAPYATAGAILDLVHRHRDRGLPTPIDSAALGRLGVAQTLIPRTLQTLHSLDLIDPKTGAPTETFEALRLAPEEKFKERLAAWLKGSYADIFSIVDPSKDGEARIRDAFRTYQPVGQQERMRLLFIGLCVAAGLMAAKPTRGGSSPSAAASAAPPRRERVRLTPEAKRRLERADSPARHAVARSNAYGLPPAIAGLVESLPPPEQGWTAAERDKFLTTFKAVLDFAIPVISKKAPTKEADDEAA